MVEGALINLVLSQLLKKVRIPGNFGDQAVAVKTMLGDDVSGLINSLLDFAVSSASGEYNIETKNEKFTTLLKEWLENINSEYNGLIPVGIQALSKEYFKERWAGASFPVLKIAKWGNIRGVIVPTKLFFVDGSSITAKDKTTSKELELLNYDYYLGDDESNLLKDDCIFAKPGRWFDKYPQIFLIKRGVYHNFLIIKMLKERGEQIIEEVIPSLLLIKKGTEALAVNNVKTYDDTELKAVVQQFQDLMDKIKTANLGDTKTKAPIRAVQFDETIEHLIPDISTMFEAKLFEVATRGILSGMGFIDIIQGISDTRKESVISPKVFMQEVTDGVDDFKQILKQLVLRIKAKNTHHRKYVNVDFHITAAPMKIFIDDKFRSQLRLLWTNGNLSDRTYTELVGNVSFDTEKTRREKEARDGTELVMYPHVTDNVENINPIDEQTRRDKFSPKPNHSEPTPRPVPTDKIGNKQKYNTADVVDGVYVTIDQLPTSVRNNMSPSMQKVFLKVFNETYQKNESETQAFRVAWGVIKKVARKNKSGKWVKKNN